MYKDYFGFDVHPFRVNPDPKFMYFSESHQEALSTLIYAVLQHKGFIVLTGEVGTGKTTVLNALLQKIDPSVQCAYLFNTKLSPDDFFIYLLLELGLERPYPFRKGEALHQLNHYLIERLRENKQTLLIVDEAQNLSVDLLEEIRMLSNLETPQSKLIQIMLVGQPELDRKLQQPEIRQLLQRVELHHTLRPLSAKETGDYVRQRMLIAGHESGDIFTKGALRAIHSYSSGIPRVINVLCDNALLYGFVHETPRIPERKLVEAALDIGLKPGGLLRLPVQAARPPREGWLRRLFSLHRKSSEHGA